MANKVIVIGIGEFGLAIVKRLNEMNTEVLAIDKDPEKILLAQNYATNAVSIDATDENSLKALGVNKYDVCVVCIGTDLESSVLITLLLKEMGVKKIYAKAVSDLQKKLLLKIGADEIILPEVEGGIRLANIIVSGDILETFVEFADNIYYAKVKVPKQFIGKTLQELNLRQQYKVNVVGITDAKQVIDFVVGPNSKILENDVLMLIGKREDVLKFAKKSD